jgi:hypothetical protein
VLSKGETIIVYQVADPNRSKRADEQWKKTPRAQRGKLTGSPTTRTTSSNVPDDEDRDGDAGEPAEPARESAAGAERGESASTDGVQRKRDVKHAQHPDTTEASKPRTRQDASSGGGPVTKPAQVR